MHICDFVLDDDLDCDRLSGWKVNGSLNLSEGALSDSATELVVANLKVTLVLGLTVHYSYNRSA